MGQQRSHKGTSSVFIINAPFQSQHSFKLEFSAQATWTLSIRLLLRREVLIKETPIKKECFTSYRGNSKQNFTQFLRGSDLRVRVAKNIRNNNTKLES